MRSLVSRRVMILITANLAGGAILFATDSRASAQLELQTFWCDDLDDPPGTWSHLDGGNQVEVIGVPQPNHGGEADDACLVAHTWVGMSEEEE